MNENLPNRIVAAIAAVGLVLLAYGTAFSPIFAVQAQPSLGTEFWAASLENQNFGDTTLGVMVYNPGPIAATVSVHEKTITGIVQLVDSVALAAGADHLFEIETPQIEGPGISSLGIFRVTSTSAVVVSQLTPLEQVESNDATQLLPTTKLGSGYTVPGLKPLDLHSYVTVVATQDDTVITVTAPAATIQGRPTFPIEAYNRTLQAPPPGSIGAGVPREFTLDAFEALNLESETGGDLSGTRVEASAPVAVFSGAKCTRVGAFGACDAINEQAWPTSQHDAEVPACLAPIRSTEPVTYRVLALTDAVQLSYEPDQPGAAPLLTQGQWTEITTDVPLNIEGTGAIAVSEFLHGDPSADHLGDPSMSLLQPRSAFDDHWDFVVPDGFDENHVVVTFTEPTESGTLTLDGTPISSNGTLLGTTGLRCLTLPIAAGPHTMESDWGMEMVIRVYGFSTFGSYSYAVT